MIYDTEKVIRELVIEVEKQRISKRELSSMAKISRQTLDNYLKLNNMPLSIFIKLCELLKLNPSSFFLENNGVIQNATNSSNVSVNQNVGAGGENELLKQENKHLKEKIELYERLLESYRK